MTGRRLDEEVPAQFALGGLSHTADFLAASPAGLIAQGMETWMWLQCCWSPTDKGMPCGLSRCRSLVGACVHLKVTEVGSPEVETRDTLGLSEAGRDKDSLSCSMYVPATLSHWISSLWESEDR